MNDDRESDWDIDPTSVFPANPAYGTGGYRRRIRLLREKDAMLALLDDSNHAMWVRVRHDGQHVTGVEAQTQRAPNTNCPFAYEALRELVGLPLAIDRAELYGKGRAVRNCTHLFDIAALAMKYARSDVERRVYDVTVPDADRPGEPVVASVAIDGRCILEWKIRRGLLTEFRDEDDNPIPMLRGFTKWAVARLKDEALEAAFVLQPAYLVSTGRTAIVDQQRDLPIDAIPWLTGACYAYRPERINAGTQCVGNVKDFSDGVIEQSAESTRR